MSGLKRHRHRLWLAAGGRCQLCGRPLAYRDSTIDHIIPRNSGGTGAIENLQVAHSDCNTLRGTARVEFFRAYCGYSLGLAEPLPDAIVTALRHHLPDFPYET